MFGNRSGLTKYFKSYFQTEANLTLSPQIINQQSVTQLVIYSLK